MNTYLLIALLVTGILPAAGFIYGRIKMRSRKALYLRMITDGVGLIAISRLFVFIKALTEGVYPTRFHIGILGIIGVFAFFFTANFGQIDALCDDRSPKLKKYRIIPLAVPAFFAIAYIAMFSLVENTEGRIITAVISAAAAAVGYYHIKHLILPDVDFGIAKCLRQFNIMAFMYSVTVVAEAYFMYIGIEIGIYITSAIGMLISGALIPSLVRGIEKWTM